MTLLLWALLGPAAAWTPSTGAVWNGPLPWTLNQDGSDSIRDRATVEAIFLQSYDAWTSPTCSAFQYRYNGTSNRRSDNNGDGQTAHGFLSSWPRGYGDASSVIGLTLSIYSGNTMQEADVSFNEQVYTFVQGAPTPLTYEADLASIATHEFGHSLGLGHTDVNGATMAPYYDNGTAQRSPANDDINGLCTLYPGGGGGGGGGSTDDGYEENDDIGASAFVGCGDVIEAHGADQDWFVVQTDATGTVGARLTWADRNVDLDLYLADDRPEFLTASEATSGSSESLQLPDLPAGAYFFLVNAYEGADDYTLEITCTGDGGGGTPPTVGDDRWEDNDQPDQAAAVNCPATIDAVAADQDWFLVTLNAPGPLSVGLRWSDAAVDLDLYVVDTQDVLGTSEAEGTDRESLDLDDLPAGTYGIVVNPYVGSIAYRLNLDCPANEPLGDTGAGDLDDLFPIDCGCQSARPDLSALAALGAWLVTRRRRATTSA